MEIMTCEQFVIQELNDTRKTVLEMQKSIDKKQEELCETRKENSELKDFLNRLLSEVELGKTYTEDGDIATLRLCSFDRNEKKLLEKIKKYKQEYVDAEKNEEEGE